MHGPDVLHGDHSGSFFGVLTANHQERSRIQWSKDGELYDEGVGLNIIWPNSNGVYHAKNGKKETKKFNLLVTNSHAPYNRKRASRSSSVESREDMKKI